MFSRSSKPADKERTENDESLHDEKVFVSSSSGMNSAGLFWMKMSWTADTIYMQQFCLALTMIYERKNNRQKDVVSVPLLNKHPTKTTKLYKGKCFEKIWLVFGQLFLEGTYFWTVTCFWTVTYFWTVTCFRPHFQGIFSVFLTTWSNVLSKFRTQCLFC